MDKKTWRLTLHEYNSLVSHGAVIPDDVEIVLVEEE